MIPKDHPRAESLMTRERLVNGFRRNLVASEGLIAHGRGEAFDYLLGERTPEVAESSVRAAAALLLLSKNAVLSVNGNAGALCPKEFVELAEITGAKIEVNLFYRTVERELAVKEELERHGAKQVLGVGERASARIQELSSERRRVDPDGIFAADTVFVPLEDGDRTETLARLGKNVITVDLNPLSRTAKAATITVVDNIVRAMPALVQKAQALKGKDKSTLRQLVELFDNEENLEQSLAIIRGGAE